QPVYNEKRYYFLKFRENNTFLTNVDWSGRHETPAGKAWPGETPQEHSDEEAPGPPAASEWLQRKSTPILERDCFSALSVNNALFLRLNIMVLALFYLAIFMYKRLQVHVFHLILKLQG